MFDKKAYRKAYYQKCIQMHPEMVKVGKDNYRAAHPEKAKAHRKRIKLLILRKISGLEIPVCKYCGCDDLRALEINHKNLGGAKEHRENRNYRYAIISGKRGVDDLEVVCRVHNAAHYLEKKFGMKFEVKYKGLGLPAALRPENAAVKNWRKRTTKWLIARAE